MPLLRPLLFTLLFALPLLSRAAVLEALYEVEVPPAEGAQQSVQLDTATRVMLQRLAGSQVDLDKGPLAAVMAEPSKVTRRIGALDEAGGMRVEFDPLLLRDALSKADVPMLGRNRPGILVWAVESTTLGDDFLLPGSEMGQALRAAANYRGVSLMQPLADLQDRTSVSEADVLKADQAVLQEAAERYAAEGMLALQVNQQDAVWALQWTFWLNDEQETGKAQSDNPQEAADQLMQALAGAVFTQYAVTSVPGDQITGWRLHITGVKGLDQFSRLQRMLQQMGTQSVPQLVSMRGEEVIFSFDFPGDEAQLQRMLMLDQRLVPVEAPSEPAPPVVTQGPADTVVDSAVENAPAAVSAEDTAAAEQETLSSAADTPPPSALPTAPQDDRKSLYYRWR